MIVLGIGSLLSIVFGFILAAMIDKEVRGEGIFLRFPEEAESPNSPQRSMRGATRGVRTPPS